MTELEGGIAAVVVAAGKGQRFADGDATPKQFRELLGKPILAWSLDLFDSHPRIDQTVVVLPVEWIDSPPDWLGPGDRLVAGGATRSDSVRRGLDALAPGIDTVLVHDGARPLVSEELLDRILFASASGDAVIPGIPVRDTLKLAGSEGYVGQTVDRANLWSVQTPQSFPAQRLRDFHARAAAENYSPTDDAALFERYGESVKIVSGDPVNLKITAPEDLLIAEALAGRRVEK